MLLRWLLSLLVTPMRPVGGVKTRLAVVVLALSGTGLVGLALDEGYRGTAYQDSVGVWTDGFGTTMRPDGSPVRQGDTTTPERALVRLHRHVLTEAEAPLRACFGEARLFDYEWDAYVRLAYNVGAHRVCASSIPGNVIAGRYAEGCAAILRFNKVRDCAQPKVINPRTGRAECPLVPLRGLTLRREREHQVCMGKGAAL